MVDSITGLVGFLFEFLTIQDGTNKLSRSVGKNYHYSLRNNPEERSSFVSSCLDEAEKTKICAHTGNRIVIHW